MARKKNFRGVPANLIPLAIDGLRIRFAGFWLNDSPHDRAIADWLNQTPRAATMVKELIFIHVQQQGGAVQIPSESPEPAPHRSGRRSKLSEFED